MFFNISIEIREQSETLDGQGNVQRAKCTARATLANGRFADASGSCDRNEKKFMAPNRDSACPCAAN
jgi:hypothetical protein